MERTYNVNGQIEADIVNLVLTDGQVKKAISLSDALDIAEDEGLDVVEVSSNGENGIPVCKMIDYGKMMYQQRKKKKNQKQIQHVKEIKYNLNIGSHDLGIRHTKILKFLSKKYTVKYTLELNGRERNMIDSAVVTINKNLEEFRDVATWKPPKVSTGRRVTISTTLVPV
jgi:translation initiation factor IF-3